MSCSCRIVIRKVQYPALGKLSRKKGILMIILEGKYNQAIVYAEELEASAQSQIVQLCNQPFIQGSRIRIMPDVHAGAGCTIGTTMTIADKAVPNLVGVDIGCGMETTRLKEKWLEVQKLDKVIGQKIPAGFAIRDKAHAYSKKIDLSALRCAKAAKLKLDRAYNSLGTLGGGNHFIEVDQADDGALYLIVHSGSRHLGLEVAKYYQELAYQLLSDEEKRGINRALAYLSGQALEDYLHDMRIVQQFAALSRQAMTDEILRAMKLDAEASFTTIHNYIDTENRILRKGAVSAQSGEQLLIPINMRDGSLVCTGLGNPDWNQSAPHGAGRLMSRSDAKNSFTVSAFKKAMQGIYTTSVGAGTLDECPMAYKDMSVIVSQIGETVTIDQIIKPIYNFKAGGE